MQNRYTGDLGDFGKYGLLRALVSGTQIPGTQISENQVPEEDREPPQLGVVWYLTPDESKSRDGRQTRYLGLDEKKRRQFAECDEELYLALGNIVGARTRGVKAVQQSAILPEGTIYYNKPLDLRGVKKGRGETLQQAREQARAEWNALALEETKDCEIVFLDPDNGLETTSVDAAALRGVKYAYYDELKSYLDREQSVVVYHHLNRGSKAIRQIYQKQREIYERLGRRAFAMRYHRGSPRAFILIPQRRSRREITDSTRRMLDGAWGRHFTMVG